VASSIVVSWGEGISVEALEGGALRALGIGSALVLPRADPAVKSATLALASPGSDEARLSDAVLDAGGPLALAAWYYRLHLLDTHAMLRRAVLADGGQLATVVPLSPGFCFDPKEAAPDRTVVLSRFALIRRDGGTLVLESPLAAARVVLDDPRVLGLLGSLASPGTPQGHAAHAVGLPSDACLLLLRLLAGAGMLEVEGSGDGAHPGLPAWEFHDLLFHTRSRRGRSDAPFGATYRLAGRLSAPPALRPSGGTERVALDHPDPDRVAREDPPLGLVMDRRCSVRAYGERPVTLRQLGEFLFRVARVTARHEAEVGTAAGPVLMDFAARPYPSGGGLYELEFYVAVNACDGLRRGLYRYEPVGHGLDRLDARDDLLALLVRDAAYSAGIPQETLQLLIILAARVPRVAWKYSSIAYSLVLKHVGVVYQTMYLAATAMNLAPCALGGGDSDLFARAAGADYYTETSVGEFLLGSRPRPKADW
jgi:SagB-type dehydrogenase family enzyme